MSYSIRPSSCPAVAGSDALAESRSTSSDAVGNGSVVPCALGAGLSDPRVILKTYRRIAFVLDGSGWVRVRRNATSSQWKCDVCGVQRPGPQCVHARAFSRELTRQFRLWQANGGAA